MSDTCEPHHDYSTNVLTALLCTGLIISYLPQHYRIISSKSSEGFSPWFLLLGSTSSASSMLNIIAVQWEIVRCCRVVSAGSCVESVAGIFQLFLQWFLFTSILVLYMIYYPPHLKYADIDVDFHDNRPPHHIHTPVRSDNWRLSITLSWVVFSHIALITFVTFLLLSGVSSPYPSHRISQVEVWATFLGVSSAALAALQYAPQLVHTYRLKLVGALSIPMMLIQSPGAVLMVLSIALRPGTNWTTWLPYAVAGVMQGALLVICLFWRARQHRLHIDDFGNPLPSSPSFPPESWQASAAVPPPAPRSNTERVVAAVGDAVQSDVRAEQGVDAVETHDERTPLISTHGKQAAASGHATGLLRWFGKR